MSVKDISEVLNRAGLSGNEIQRLVNSLLTNSVIVGTVGDVVGRSPYENHIPSIIKGMSRSRLQDPLCETISKDPEERQYQERVNASEAKRKALDYLEKWLTYQTLWGADTRLTSQTN